MSSVVDPIAALVTVFQDYVSYASDDASPVTEDYSNDGLFILVYPQEKAKQRTAPLIEVGPLLHTEVSPENIGNTPNSRWLHKHFIQCSIETQTYQSPNISGYNGVTKIWESIRANLVSNQTTVDGSGNWLLMRLSAGPYIGPGTVVTPDRYEYVFVVELWRSVVN